MSSTFIQHFYMRWPIRAVFQSEVFERARTTSVRCLFGMDTERRTELGLEPMLTTSELADYLGVAVQAIYDLRSAGRGPTGVRIGRELRYRIDSDVRPWLDRLRETDTPVDFRGGGDA